MRRLVLCASVAAAAIALPAAAMAAQPAVTTTALNLRAGPGTDYPVVATLPGGARLRIEGCIAGYNWCSIVWRGDYGWVNGDYLAALYRGQRVVVIDEGPAIGIPIVSFNIGPYWRAHYRHRGFYARIGEYRGGHVARGGGRHAHGQPRIDRQGRAGIGPAPAAGPRHRHGTVGLGVASPPQHGPRFGAPHGHAPRNAGVNAGHRGFGHPGPAPRAATTGAAPHGAPAFRAGPAHAPGGPRGGGGPGHRGAVGGHAGGHGAGPGPMRPGPGGPHP